MSEIYALLCPKGCTRALQLELKEAGIKTQEGGIDWVSANLTAEQRAWVHNYSQATTTFMQLLHQGSLEAIETHAGQLKPNGSFCVRADGQDRQEQQERVGGIIKDNSGAPVNLSKPDVTYIIHEVDGEYLLGIDCAGNLAKRHYKIITGATSLTGPLAYCVLRMSGWTPKTDLVVWPSATGELAIEAALAAIGKSVRAYERNLLTSHEPTCRIVCADPKLSLVRSAEKNAKVAGAQQAIRFSRQDADWLDTKYDEHGVSMLVGVLPNLKLQPKLPKEIFYQLEFILKPKGKASFLCVNDASSELLEEHAVDYETSRQYVWSGKHCSTLVTLIRKAKQKKQKGD